MRRIGTLSSERDARALSDYLYTLKIENRVSGHDGAWEIWSLNEDQLERGRQELAAFQAAPHDPKYSDAAGAARAKRDAEVEAVVAAAKQTIHLRERWERPAWQQTPVTFFVVALCILVTLFAGFGKNEEVTQAIQIETRIEVPVVNRQVRYAVPLRALDEVRRGQVWRLVTPIFLHMDPMHLIGNLFLGIVLSSMIERERGSWRLLLGILLTAIVSNVAQYAVSGPRFGGLSGVVYGMFGYVWLMGRVAPEFGLQISRESAMMMTVWLIVCWFGVVGQVANVCHVMGLAMGLLLAAVEIFFRRLRT
ncbi:MAG: rhomboid family intramembrane serine protease [Planctomycetaceae bacterium]